MKENEAERKVENGKKYETKNERRKEFRLEKRNKEIEIVKYVFFVIIVIFYF